MKLLPSWSVEMTLTVGAWHASAIWRPQPCDWNMSNAVNVHGVEPECSDSYHIQSAL